MLHAFPYTGCRAARPAQGQTLDLASHQPHLNTTTLSGTAAAPQLGLQRQPRSPMLLGARAGSCFLLVGWCFFLKARTKSGHSLPGNPIFIPEPFCLALSHAGVARASP